MYSVLVTLNSKEIINKYSLSKLKYMIRYNFPDVSLYKQNSLLVLAIYKILDEFVPEFSIDLKKEIKNKIIKELLNNKTPSISMTDIFNISINCGNFCNSFFSALRIWLEKNISKKISKENLFKLVYEFRKNLNNNIIKDSTKILYSIERQIGGIINKQVVHQRIDSQYNIDNKKSFDTLSEFSSENSTIYAHYEKDIPFKEIKFNKNSHHNFKNIIAYTLFCASFTFGLWAGNNFVESLPEINIKNSSWFNQKYPIESLINDNNTLNSNVNSNIIKLNTPVKKFEMIATAYDLSIQSCGKSPNHPEYGITFSGKKATVGRTVAVDPTIIPLGSLLKITFPDDYKSLDGYYIAEDTGIDIKGNKIDIYFGEDINGGKVIYEKALQFGIQNVQVEIL